MDLFESMDNMERREKLSEVSKHEGPARKYASQGFDQELIAELLQIDGCSLDISKELATAAVEDLPLEYTDRDCPKIYEDLKDIVEETILSSASYNTLKEYIEKYAHKTYKDLASRILIAKDNPSRVILDEIHNELRPLVEDRIYENNVIAKGSSEVKTADKKEELEYKLFGVWPVYLIQKHANKEKIEENLIDSHVRLQEIDFNYGRKKD